MTKSNQAIVWAAGIIAFALLGAIGLVPQDVTEFGVIALPALAATSIFAGGRCPAKGCRA